MRPVDEPDRGWDGRNRQLEWSEGTCLSFVYLDVVLTSGSFFRSTNEGQRDGVLENTKIRIVIAERIAPRVVRCQSYDRRTHDN